MAEMVVNGVSTRKVSQVVETLCGTYCSKSAVSELCKDLDASVKEFRERSLNGRYRSSPLTRPISRGGEPPGRFKGLHDCL